MATVSSSQHGLHGDNNGDGQAEVRKAFLAEVPLKSRMPISSSQSAYNHNEINLSNEQPTNNAGHGPRIRSKSGSQTADQKNAWAEKIALQ